MLTPVATDIPTMPRAVEPCCWKITSGTIGATPVNGTENRPGFRSRTVRMVSHELVGHADPDIPVPRVPPFSTPGSVSTNRPPGLIGVQGNFASDSNVLVKLTDARFGVVRWPKMILACRSKIRIQVKNPAADGSCLSGSTALPVGDNR